MYSVLICIYFYTFLIFLDKIKIIQLQKIITIGKIKR